MNIFRKLLKTDYHAHLEREVTDSVYDARRRYIELVQQQLYTDAMVQYQFNRIKFLSRIYEKLKGPQDDKANCITRAAAYSDYNLQHGQGD